MLVGIRARLLPTSSGIGIQQHRCRPGDGAAVLEADIHPSDQAQRWKSSCSRTCAASVSCIARAAAGLPSQSPNGAAG